VFGSAGVLLAVAGLALWRTRTVPCPSDPRLARTCARLRALSTTIYVVALVAFVLGATFAFVLPRL
jgi:hypothetical protein